MSETTAETAGTTNQGRLAGKTALVTGAARGIGAATAELFVAEGAKVALADINVEAGQALADSLGESAIFVELDVANETSWGQALDTTETAFGGLDVLVNNAGIYTTCPIEELTVELFTRIFEINQLGVFLGIKTCASALRRRGGGSIINLSSTSGLKGNQNSMAYGSTKWAVRGMTKVAAVELGSEGIRVNSVHPGIIDTPMNHEEIGDEKIKAIGQSSPLGRHGTADEIADLILFLASDASSYISGSEHVIDGAMNAGTQRKKFTNRETPK